MVYGREVLKKEFNYENNVITIETGKIAGQANGSVLVTSGGTAVLVTATCSEQPREGIDFFPLTVDYEERLYAVGKIPGGFIKKEGRPSDKAILTCRLIDRPIRPLFPKNYRNDVQIVSTVLSVDQDCPPDIIAMIGASAALTISDIPFKGPIGAVRVGLINNEVTINPILEKDEKSNLHLVVAGTKDAIMMVEAGADEIPEETILEGILEGHEFIKKLVNFIEEFRKEAFEKGFAKEKQEVNNEFLTDEIKEKIYEYSLPIINKTLKESSEKKYKKAKRESVLKEVKTKLQEYLLDNFSDLEEEFQNFKKLILTEIDAIEKECMRKMVVIDKIRIDGRKIDEIRPITCEVGVLPKTHGSGLFTRGETQVLTVSTLGAVSDEQIIEGLGVEESKRYMHHYNFPPFSVGEARPMRGPGRREIGHGALAEKALEPMIPKEEDFPYTIRLVSEVLSSNGSTSMGSVCGSTLSLMDAGVSIKKPVAGVAMGLIKEDDDVVVLTDIQGVEDALGDMDFKVAGTRDGITALQMDIKIGGINKDILIKALQQAKNGRLHIMEKMLDVLPEPRTELSPFAPRIIRTKVDADKIRDIIGPGGKTIKKIIDETGVKIDIEDDGNVFIAAEDNEGSKKAIEYIDTITKEVEIGKIYLGKVTRVTDFGAFVEVVPGVLGLSGKEGLVHISQLAPEHIDKVEDVVKEGEEILVKAKGFDHMGRLKLSRKDALPQDEIKKENNGNKEKPYKRNSKKFKS